MKYNLVQRVIGPSIRVPRDLTGGSTRLVRQQLYVRKLSNNGSKHLPLRLLNEFNWKGKEKDNSAMEATSLFPGKWISVLVQWWETSHVTSISLELCRRLPACRQNNSTVSRLPLARIHRNMFTTICKLERAPITLHGSKWYVPARAPEGQETWPEKSHIALTDHHYWLLPWQPVWVESNTETLSMLIHPFFNVIHHDCKTVRRLLLLLIVCLSSLKCDSGVMDNCTAILTTVSSILSISSFSNVHYYCSHKRAPTIACPCGNHIRRTSEEAGTLLELDLWWRSMVELFLHGRLCVA